MINSYTDEEIERCTLSGQREIVFQLRSLIRHGARVSVSFDEGRQSFLTVLIDLADDEAELYFDIGGSEETNRAFLKAERCLFAGVVDGIRLQFSAKQARQVTLQGEQVFAVAVPKSLLRLQRRDAFRLQLPSSTPYICRIRRGSPAETALPLHDISLGGVGIHSTEALSFEAMEQLENCWIDLHDSGMLAVTLEVRYVMSSESRTGKPVFHMGCRFLKLSPMNETLIQRFMARIEAERRALSAG
jgi:c-di-GMP-binding flagellar brake protein YcgR